MDYKNKNKTKKAGKRLGVLAVMILTLMLCAACGKKKAEEEKASKDIVFTVGDEQVSLPEVNIYAEIVREHYENAYGNGVWSLSVYVEDMDEVPLEEMTRQDIINDIVQVKLLKMEAEERAITLTEEEEQEIATESARFWKYMTDDEMERTGITEDLVNRVMRENLLAKKMYDKIIQDAGLTVSDEEARETRFYDLFFPGATVNEDGTVTPLSDEQVESIHQKAIDAYDSLLNPTEEGSSGVHVSDMERLKKTYQLDLSEEVVMTPEEITNTYGSEIHDMLYKLEDGSYSLVTQSAYGYHIFYMIALTDRETTDSRKEVILKEKRQAYFETEKEKLLEKYAPGFKYENSVNMDLYNEITFE